ncbi:DUF4240 domain-containing protein [Streptomyces xanthophaeus]|uniref:DUF4240 domain-containing protein n=1 Tax=Streptomyces xanthophaeus TaxID=67385 RepID=UPI003696F21A
MPGTGDRAGTPIPNDGEAVAREATSLPASWPVEEIVAAEQVRWDLMVDSCSNPLWAAAYLAHGGCSDDGFDYFRGWLIAQGCDVFERVAADPDALAELPIVQAPQPTASSWRVRTCWASPGTHTSRRPVISSQRAHPPSAIGSWTPPGTRFRSPRRNDPPTAPLGSSLSGVVRSSQSQDEVPTAENETPGSLSVISSSHAHTSADEYVTPQHARLPVLRPNTPAPTQQSSELTEMPDKTDSLQVLQNGACPI